MSIDIVLSRHTESGDRYLERYIEDSVDNLVHALWEATDIGYTMEVDFIILESGMLEESVIKELIDEVINDVYNEEMKGDF